MEDRFADVDFFFEDLLLRPKDRTIVAFFLRVRERYRVGIKEPRLDHGLLVGYVLWFFYGRGHVCLG